MNIIYILIPLAILLGLIFLIGYIWCTISGQYDDLDTPAYKILVDERKAK